jgi:hypothetical protein
MGIGIWKFNPVSQDLFWDESMYELFEVNPTEFSGHYQAWESSLSPEAKEKAVKELGMALSGEKEFESTFEIVTRSGVRKTAQNVKLSLSTSSAAQEKANGGRMTMDRMAAGMKEIQKANSQLQAISKVIEDIHSKTKIINDIVFKTQLLSFNASIEAARAGQHGRGFAVVAEEVGNLADLSGRAAKEIESLLGDSQRQVSSTLRAIDDRVIESNSVSHQAHSAFKEILKQIEEINSQVKSINEATHQQEIGIQQTNTAMRQMDSASQNNTHASSQALITVEKLKMQTNAMTDAMNDLVALVDGGELKVKRLTSEVPAFDEPSVEPSNDDEAELADLARAVAQKQINDPRANRRSA